MTQKMLLANYAVPFIHKNKKLLLILLLALLTRLYHIDFPIAGWHSWRQADTAAIARNFATENMNILLPAIDWRGSTPGYVECEFQLYTYIIALLYKMFGAGEFWGRLLSVLCALATIWGLYLLVKKSIDERTALWAAFFYSVLPLSIYYGRAFMPEQMMLMFSLFGIYFFAEWIERDRNGSIILSTGCISLAVLLKLPTLYIGLPLLYLSWTKYKLNFIRKPKVLLCAFTVFFTAFLWYYHAHSLKSLTGLTFGIWEAGTDKWGNIDIVLSFKFYNDVLFKSIAERHFTYPAFLLFVLGLFLKRITRKEKVFDYWLIAVLVYFLIVAKGNQVHEYYQLPFMLPGVVFLAKAFSRRNEIAAALRLSEKTNFGAAAFLLLAILILSSIRAVKIFDGEQYNSPIFALSAEAQRTTEKDDLIVAVSGGNPAALYNLQRKGWNSSPLEITAEYLHKRKDEGARYVVGEKELFIREGAEEKLQSLLKHYAVIVNADNYFIVRL